jgi:hypothetical protein
MPAAIAAASSGDATLWRTSIRGRGGACFPFLDTGRSGYRRPPVPELPLFDQQTVLSAVSPADAIERVRDGFVQLAHGDWAMPPKTYLDAPPGGDFRAMPARGGGLAILKWVTSFPGNPARGLPVVMGVICVSDAGTGEPLALVDVRAVTALRTGAVAAVAAQELAREDARTAAVVGCGVHGAWAARCLAAAEYGPGVCFDPDPDRAGAVAGELGWEVGDLRVPGARAGGPGRGPATGHAPVDAWSRRRREGRGGGRRRQALRALLRRVGAGQPRR